MAKKMVLLIVGLGLIFLVGCSKAPETAMKNAETSMQAASTADAEQYAPNAYKMAADTLNAAKAEEKKQASKFFLFKSYGKAQKMYESAQVLAENAVTEANAEKERIKAQVDEMLKTVKMSLDSAAVAVEKAPRGKGSRADIELIKVDLNAAQAGYNEAMTDFNNGEYMNAQAKLEAVGQKAEAVINEINKAKAMKQTSTKK